MLVFDLPGTLYLQELLVRSKIKETNLLNKVSRSGQRLKNPHILLCIFIFTSPSFYVLFYTQR